MPYLTEEFEIKNIINQLTSAKILWLDTEVADWETENPRLSLIQATANPIDRTGDKAYVLDVLDRPDLVAEFVEKIMVNPNIEKVFHNAPFDVKYLGGKQIVKNVTCTFKMVRKLSKKRRKEPLVVTNKKLKTLATELCQFTEVDSEQQASDWGQRPLTQKQLQYAKMDVVYLSHVHQFLLNLKAQQFLQQTV
ncbi:MAG: hypothetical protein ACOC04_00575 [Halothece sp.]